MDLELQDLHIIENLVNYLLIPDLARIVIEYLGFRQTYNRLIDQNIDHYQSLIRDTSNTLEQYIQLQEYIELRIGLFWEVEAVESHYLIELHFDYAPTFNTPIDIRFSQFVWEILDLPEPIDYSDTDL